MDSTKIKQIRSRLTIPLNRAVELLKRYDGNINTCVQEFHNENIKEIIRKTECDVKTVKEYYSACNNEIVKTIESINSREVIITTRNTKLSRSEIGFILWPENKDGKGYKTSKRNDIFIPTSDFEYIIDEFKDVFPLKDPFDNITEEYFDVTGNNYFDNETSKKIIKNVSKIKTKEPKVKKFISELAEWFNEKLEYADYIVVYGNL